MKRCDICGLVKKNKEFYYLLFYKKHATTCTKCRNEIYKKACDVVASVGYFDSADYFDKLDARIEISFRLEKELRIYKKENISQLLLKNFYISREWKSLRVKALVKYGKKCCLCGRTANDGVILHVDHIKSRSKYPELALEIDNLQILCEPCNIGKSNKYEEDWRKSK